MSPASNPELPSPPLNQFPEYHVYTSSKYLQDWFLNVFLGQPVPVLDKPFKNFNNSLRTSLEDLAGGSFSAVSRSLKEF